MIYGSLLILTFFFFIYRNRSKSKSNTMVTKFEAIVYPAGLSSDGYMYINKREKKKERDTKTKYIH